MRIDYSEPRQSSGSGSSSSGSSPRKVDSSSSGSLMLWFVLAGVIFSIGFGTGWFFSQKATKRAFRAATEQQSLESAFKDTKKQPEQSPSQQPTQAAPAAPSTVTGQPSQQASPVGQVPLSFFESLPKGQKQAVLGSGINEKPKPVPSPAPQPTQAAAPTVKTADTKPAGSGFLVQVAAFTNAKEAESTKAKLVAKGYSAIVSEKNLDDKGTWYRVRIGRHLDKDSASEIASRVGGGAKVMPDQE